MSRVTVHQYDEDGNQGEAVGWFDPEQADVAKEADPMTASRFASLRRRGEAARFIREALYRTPGGRWVHQETAHLGPKGTWVENEGDVTPSLPGPARRHRFLGDEEATAWLSVHARPEDAERLLRDTAQEAGPVGRPEIGQPVQVRLGELLPAVDEWATSRGCSRAGALRHLVEIGLAHSTP